MNEYMHILYVLIGFLLAHILGRVATHLCYIRYLLADISNKLKENK